MMPLDHAMDGARFWVVSASEGKPGAKCAPSARQSRVWWLKAAAAVWSSRLPGLDALFA